MTTGRRLAPILLAWAALASAAQAGSDHVHVQPVPSEARAPADDRLVSAWALSALDSGDPRQIARAETRVREWLEREPRRLEAWLLRARLAAEGHRFEEALGHARRAEEMAPEDPRVWELLGDLHHARGHRVEAGALYRGLADRWPSAAAHGRMARWQLSRGALDEAAAAHRRSLEAAAAEGLPNRDRALLEGLGAELAERRGDLVGAGAALDRARALDPESPYFPRAQARLLLRQGRSGEAVAQLRALARRAPGPAVWIGLADALEAEGDGQQAQVWRTRAETQIEAALERGEPAHVRELVEHWLAHGGDAERAARLALGELRAVRQDGASLETAAWAVHRAGRSDEAAALARRALDRGDASPRLLARSGIILAAAGRAAEARALGRIALASPQLDAILRAELERALAPERPRPLAGGPG